VARVHDAVRRNAASQIVLVGKPTHDETVGTMGEVPEHTHVVASIDDVERLNLNPEREIVFVTQTTWSIQDAGSIIAAIHHRYPNARPAIAVPAASADARPENLHGSICYATENRQQAVIAGAEVARSELLDLADQDAHAFDSVMAAFKMPKDTDEDKAARSAAIQAGYLSAASVPRDVARRCVDLMELAEDATAMGNPQAASDGMSAAASLYSGALCAMANVEINVASLKDEAARQVMLDEMATLKSRADQLLREGQTAFQLRLSP